MSGSDNQRAVTSVRFGLYGWSMVFVAAVLMCATLPGRTHGLGLITKGLIEDVEISKMDFAQINLWATLIGALFCLPCGWLIDRFGLRRVAVCVVMGLGVAVLMLAASRSMLQVSFWVTLTRGLGQSMLSVVSITLIGKSVSHSLPIAMGAYSVLLSTLVIGLLSGLVANLATGAAARFISLRILLTIALLGLAVSSASAFVASFISVPDASRGDWDPVTISLPASEVPDLCPTNP